MGALPDRLPIILVPGLNCSARLYAGQIPDLWRFGPVTVADHTRDVTVAAVAHRILATAPPRFALAGLSMGGYVALALATMAPGRLAKLALLSTRAAPDTPAEADIRRERIALTRAGRFAEVGDLAFQISVHTNRLADETLRATTRLMADEVGPQAYVRQQEALLVRDDMRPRLAEIACPTLVLVGDGDRLTPPVHAREMAAGIPGARLVVVPECGHLSALEHPEAVSRALVEWIAG